MIIIYVCAIKIMSLKICVSSLVLLDILEIIKRKIVKNVNKKIAINVYIQERFQIVSNVLKDQSLKMGN